MILTKRIQLLMLLLAFAFGNVYAVQLSVGQGKKFAKIKDAIAASKNGDTILVYPGLYKEGNIIIDKSVWLQGINYPVIDGEKKFEIFSIKSNHVSLTGLQIQHSSQSTLEDPGGIKVYDASWVRIENNILIDNYFGIYLQYATNCSIKNNRLHASHKEEYQSGNGIHCWKSDSLQIEGNSIVGHRDGIYFEFVTHSVIWRNISKYNIRYGLHFMFSHQNAYISNYFKNNGAGVAVMFTKKVTMLNNTFEENWGDAAYGVLFKELSDCYLSGNTFIRNTTAIFFDGSNRIIAEKNKFIANGWAMKIQANCVDNIIRDNNFIGNTFDVATNGSLTLNTFNSNYWDKYEGYDLNRDNWGDVPYHPLSVYAVIVERYPTAMLFFRSFMIGLLDKSEKVLPSLTPENFVDNRPRMKPIKL